MFSRACRPLRTDAMPRSPGAPGSGPYVLEEGRCSTAREPLCLAEALGSLLALAEARMELAEGGRVERIRGQLVALCDGLQLFEPSARPERHSEGDRAAQRDDRRGPHLEERFVQARDLGPVRLLDAPGLAMKRRDRRFEVERARRVASHGAPEKAKPLPDQLPVPARAVLLGERYELASLDACFEPRCVKAHQRDERVALRRRRRRQLDEPERESQRLVAELLAHHRVGMRAMVALVEQEMQRVVHVIEPGPDIVVRAHIEERAELRERLPRADQPLLDRRLRGKKRLRDLADAETARIPQDDGELRVRAQRGVAAGEDEAQIVVLDRVLVEERVDRRQQRPLRLKLGSDPPLERAAPHQVDGAVPRRAHQPCRRVVRHPPVLPCLERGAEDILHRVLSEREVLRPQRADQRRDHPARLAPEEMVNELWSGSAHVSSERTGRTSTLQSPSRAGHPLARSTASSRERAVITVYPPTRSFASAYGASVANRFGPRTVFPLFPSGSPAPWKWPFFVRVSIHAIQLFIICCICSGVLWVGGLPRKRKTNFSIVFSLPPDWGRLPQRRTSAANPDIPGVRPPRICDGRTPPYVFSCSCGTASMPSTRFTWPTLPASSLYASSSLSRTSSGFSARTFAVCAIERVAAVSSRRRITFASASFCASITRLSSTFISPGRTRSLRPRSSSSRPSAAARSATAGRIAWPSSSRAASSSSSVRVATASRDASCTARYSTSSGARATVARRRASATR